MSNDQNIIRPICWRAKRVENAIPSSSMFCEGDSPGICIELGLPGGAEVSGHSIRCAIGGRDSAIYVTFMTTLDQAMELGEFLVKLAPAEAISDEAIAALYSPAAPASVGLFENSIGGTSWNVASDPTNGRTGVILMSKSIRFWMPEDSMRELGRIVLALAMPDKTHCSRPMNP